MVETASLAATTRARAGTGPARATRRAGSVPGVLYGKDVEPVLLSLDRKELERALARPGFFIHMLDLTLDGKPMRVLPRDIQYHPVTDAPIHADFVRYAADRHIHIAVPVQFVNQDASPGIKRGGVLNIVRHEIEVTCRPDAIPDHFTVDLAGSEIGLSIHASVLTLPEDVKFVITDRDFTIATIAAPTVDAGPAAEAAAGDAGKAATPAKS